jgi:hypothetical protein
VTPRHDWQLVAPWYRWPRPAQAVRRRGRGTPPVIQKYDDSKLVDAFLADPQKSLRYMSEDLVFDLVALTDTIKTGPFQGYRKQFATQVPRRTDTRKLFLGTHKRFYLVVFDLRCDAPGFPRANHEDVCEAGLVVRRPSIRYPADRRDEARAVLADIAAMQAELTRLERPPAKMRRRKGLRGRPAPPGLNGSAPEKADARRLQLVTGIAASRRVLAAWRDSAGLRTISEGWIPGGLDNVGEWQPVADEPQTLSEQVTQMFPLIPDPREARHSGHFGTLYFGLLPTASSEVTADGTARFDDTSLYQVRCFVRRHRPECPRTGEADDCGGRVFWSAPTAVYRLAPAFDLEGTAHRPLTIKLPDLKDLAAQTLTKPMGTASPVKMVAPPDSSLDFKSLAGVPFSPSLGSRTCFWCIPLITIVALFLLNLFLPVVVALFSLYWMLLLKFCSGLPIPGGFKIDQSIITNLDSLDDGVAQQLSDQQLGALRDTIAKGIDEQFGTPPPRPQNAPPRQGEKTAKKPSDWIKDEQLGSEAIARLQLQLLNPPAAGPDFVGDLKWEAHVEPDPEPASVGARA